MIHERGIVRADEEEKQTDDDGCVVVVVVVAAFGPPTPPPPGLRLHNNRFNRAGHPRLNR